MITLLIIGLGVGLLMALVGWNWHLGSTHFGLTWFIIGLVFTMIILVINSVAKPTFKPKSRFRPHRW